MTYTVVYAIAAAQELLRVEQAVPDPGRVREAAARMEFMPRRYPRDQGESREPGFRVWYEDVLGMYYRVDDVNLRVEVVAVGPARRR